MIIFLFIAVLSCIAAEDAGFDFYDSPDCSLLAQKKTTVVIFTGPLKSPYLPELLALPSLSPELASDGNVLMLNLSNSRDTACSRAIYEVKQGSLLVYWEDGNLSQSWKSYPQLKSKIEGSIAVFGKTGRLSAGISSLSLISSLESVAGSLFIYDLDSLVDLKGLEKLKIIGGGLIVSNNDGLASLQGLNSLTSINGSMILNSNQLLLSVKGLEALEVVSGQLIMKGNGNLISLSALTSLTRVGSSLLINNANEQLALPSSVQIGSGRDSSTKVQDEGISPEQGLVFVLHGPYEIPSLIMLNQAYSTAVPPLSVIIISLEKTRFVNLSSAAPLPSSLNGDLLIVDDSSLTAELLRRVVQPLTSISGNLVLLSSWTSKSPVHVHLTSFQGFNSLVSVGTLGVVKHPALRDLKGLDSLSEIRGSLVLFKAQSLTSLSGLGAKYIDVSESESERTASVQVQEGPATADGNITHKRRILSLLDRIRGIRSDGGQKAGPGLRTLGSSLWISGCPWLVSLDALSLLETVFWDLTIQSNQVLPTIKLPSLRIVGGEVAIIDNPNLSTIVMNPLESLGMSLVLLYNPLLKNLDAFSRLTVVSTDLVISGNRDLSSLQGLGMIESVGLNLVVSGTEQLSSLQGLESLKSVGAKGGHLVLQNNKKLTSLASLTQLNTIGEDVYLRNNPLLVSMGFGPGLSILGSVFLADNPALGVSVAQPKVSGFIYSLGNQSKSFESSSL